MFLCVSVPWFYAKVHCAALLSNRKKIKINSSDTSVDMSLAYTLPKSSPVAWKHSQFNSSRDQAAGWFLSSQSRESWISTPEESWVLQLSLLKTEKHVSVFNIWVISPRLLRYLKNNYVPDYMCITKGSHILILFSYQICTRLLGQGSLTLTRIWASSSWLTYPAKCSGWPWDLT